jgi:hypothetical protein
MSSVALSFRTLSTAREQSNQIKISHVSGKFKMTVQIVRLSDSILCVFVAYRCEGMRQCMQLRYQVFLAQV